LDGIRLTKAVLQLLADMDGLLIIDKPAGMTSHDVVGRARRILREKRIGHTGTLDPFATGVLVLMVGQATRLARFLGSAEKEYETVIRLGYATDTGDLTGKPVGTEEEFSSRTAHLRTITRAEVETAMATLTGSILQTPPMYSAKKVQGRKLYELARAGEEIDREAVSVHIKSFELLSGPYTEGPFTYNQDGTMDLSARVVSSAGTYVRTLGESLGEALGTKAHLTALRRTRAGRFSLVQAVTLDRLAEEVETGKLAQLMVSPAAALPDMPFLHLSEQQARMARNGMALDTNVVLKKDVADGEFIRLLNDSGDLVAIGDLDRKSGKVNPRIVMTAAKSR
jgi:tRNA pseudouridine55 synthase